MVEWVSLRSTHPTVFNHSDRRQFGRHDQVAAGRALYLLDRDAGCDFANWKMAGLPGGGIGGAMDLAACAKHVFVAMEHQTRDGKPRLVERCALPPTARGVVNLVVTNLGLFEITEEGMALREIAPGVTVEEIKGTTGFNLIVPPELSLVRMIGNRSMG